MTSTVRSGSSTELAARLGAEVSIEPADDLTDVVRRRLFDTIGAIAAGQRVPSSIALDDVRDGGHGVLDHVRALVGAARCSEIDDIDRGSCVTPGSVAVPVALLLGAARGASPDAVLAGVVAGYEAMVRFGDAIDGANLLYRGVWPSYLAAPFAAAATAARVLRLDVARTSHALSIAATRSVGIAGRIDDDATSRWMTYGCAAADGVLAALAAEAGMVGDPRALDVALAAATAVRVDPDRFAQDDAGDWRIERIDVKPICTAWQVQATIEAARMAASDLDGAVREIELIEVGVPAAYRGMIDQSKVAGRLSSIMSAQFQVAAALTDEDLLFDVVRGDLSLSAEGETIRRQTVVVVDDELTPLFPAVWPARVRLRLHSGTEHISEIHHPAGSAERPLGWDSLRDKHRRVGAMPAQRLERVHALCTGLGLDPHPQPVTALVCELRQIPSEKDGR